MQELLEILGIPDDLPAPMFVANNPITHSKHLKYAVKVEDLPEFVREYQEGALEEFNIDNLDTLDLGTPPAAAPGSAKERKEEL